MRQPLEPGTTLRFPDGNEYEILGLLGQGGSALIYDVRDLHSELYFALKELFPVEGFCRRQGEVVPQENTPAARAALAARKESLVRQETRLSQKAFQNNFQVLPLRSRYDRADMTLPDGQRYRRVRNSYARMDSLREKGMPLGQYLEEYRCIHGVLPMTQAVALAKTSLEAYAPLHAAHYLHGDCQTGNLFLLGADPVRGKPGVACILDFGSARELLEDGQTQVITGGVYSTPGYRAPELLHHDVAFRMSAGCDVWPLGLLFCHFLTGLLDDWTGPEREELTDYLLLHPDKTRIKRGRAAALDLDEATLALTNRLLAKAMAEDPVARYPNAGAMLADLLELERCLTLDVSRGVSRELLWEASCRYCRRNPSLFRTEHIPTLVDELPVKKLTVYAALDGDKSLPAVDLLKALSRGIPVPVDEMGQWWKEMGGRDKWPWGEADQEKLERKLRTGLEDTTSFFWQEEEATTAITEDDWEILSKIFNSSDREDMEADWGIPQEPSQEDPPSDDCPWSLLEMAELMGMPDKSELREEKQAKPEPPPLPRRPDSRSVYLHAPGGSGKSFATAELFLDLLKTGDQIPLYLDLVRFTPEVMKQAGGQDGVIPLLLARQYFDGNGRTAEQIEALLSQVTGEYRVCLVLDNLHKVPGETADAAYAAIRRAEETYANTWLLVVGRRGVPREKPEGSDRFLPLPHRLEISLLPKAEMVKHAQTVLQKRPLQLSEDDPLYKFEAARKERLPFWDADAIMKQQDVVGRPLFFMRYLEILTRPTGEFDLPNGRAEILSLYFGRREYEANDRTVHDFLTRHMPWVAYRAMLTGRPEYTRAEIEGWLLESCGRWGGREGLLDDFLREAVDNLAILSPAGMDTFRFAHDCYQEYFAGVAIAEQIKRTLEEGDLRHLKKIDHRWAVKSDSMWLELCTMEMSNGQVRRICTMESPLDELAALLKKDLELGRRYARYLPYNVYAAYQGEPRFAVLRRDEGMLDNDVELEKYYGWFRLGAEFGIPEMQYSYGDHLLNTLCTFAQGDEREQAQETAIDWMSRAGEQGYLSAQRNLYSRYHWGVGTPLDLAKALYWGEKAAEQGDLQAQYDVGMMYHHGHGTTANDAKAAKWLLGPAKAGHVELRYDAQTTLTKLYLTALGPEGELPQATDELSAAALYQMGHMFDVGDTVMEDRKAAMEYYTRAARLGHAEAQYHLGMAYLNGAGVEKDTMQAALWLARSAIRAGAKGCEAFAKCLEEEAVLAVFEKL